jgi:peptidoglycan/LPS O-acetylase OafA/YrhL
MAYLLFFVAALLATFIVERWDALRRVATKIALVVVTALIAIAAILMFDGRDFVGALQLSGASLLGFFCLMAVMSFVFTSKESVQQRSDVVVKGVDRTC